MAKYPYIVNKNGVWYASGAEVPEDSKTEKSIKLEKQDDFPATSQKKDFQKN